MSLCFSIWDIRCGLPGLFFLAGLSLGSVPIPGQISAEGCGNVPLGEEATRGSAEEVEVRGCLPVICCII